MNWRAAGGNSTGPSFSQHIRQSLWEHISVGGGLFTPWARGSPSSSPWADSAPRRQERSHCFQRHWLEFPSAPRTPSPEPSSASARFIEFRQFDGGWHGGSYGRGL